MMELDSPKDIRVKIMDYLARRDHSKKEILKKMTSKVSSLELLLTEIDKLEVEGYINEQRFAEDYVNARVFRGNGPLKIKAELRNKGINDNVILAATLLHEETCVINAHKALVKKFGHINAESYEEIQKLKLKKQRFLGSRGFSFEAINAAMKKDVLIDN